MRVSVAGTSFLWVIFVSVPTLVWRQNRQPWTDQPATFSRNLEEQAATGGAFTVADSTGTGLRNWICYALVYLFQLMRVPLGMEEVEMDEFPAG